MSCFFGKLLRILHEGHWHQEVNADHKEWTGCVQTIHSKVLHFWLTIDGPQEGDDIFAACRLTSALIFVV